MAQIPRCFAVMHNTLQNTVDATATQLPYNAFEGKMAVVNGITRQVMPVIIQGGQASIVSACNKCSCI